jgi:hypothetical protein
MAMRIAMNMAHTASMRTEPKLAAAPRQYALPLLSISKALLFGNLLPKGRVYSSLYDAAVGSKGPHRKHHIPVLFVPLAIPQPRSTSRADPDPASIHFLSLA